MAKKIGSRTVTIIRKQEVDRLSEDTPEESAHDITGCAVLPRTSHEEDRGWVIVDGRTIIAPYGADVIATDLAEVDGERWSIDGAPGDYEDKKARGKATIFYLKRVGKS